MHDVLRKGTGTRGGRLRVAHFFSSQEDIKIQAQFLQKEYGWGGATGPNFPISYNYDSRGLHLTRKADGYNETFSWRKVAGEIDRLLENETYLSDDESKLYQYNEQIFSNFQESPLFEFDKLDNGQVNVFLEDELVARIDTVGQVSYVVELEDRFKFEIDEYVQNLETSLLIEKISQHEQLDLFDDSAFDDSSVDDTISVAEGINSADHITPSQSTRKPDLLDNYILDNLPHSLSPSERLDNNLEAIRIIKKLDLEGRRATFEEQKSLALYVGWGGLADVFNEEKTGQWLEARNELTELLSPEEFQAAKESTLTAFYTPPLVVTGKELTGRAKDGILHLINSGASALDGSAAARDENGQPTMKEFWNMTEEDVKACLEATDWCRANYEYFRGGGFSSHFKTEGELPVTLIRVNLVKDVGPSLQIAEGYTCPLDDEVHRILDERTDRTWPTTWFAPNLGQPGFETVYDVMNHWGSNHGAFVHGHIGAEVITLASMLRIPVALHNVPRERIFRPAIFDGVGTKDLEAADFKMCEVLGPLYSK